MKPSLHNTDMDFRVIPSAIPLLSPSPDKKNGNNITPTVSPNTIEIKKNITPLKRNYIEKENSKYYPDRTTDMKYATHSPGMDYSSALKEKEQVIRNLKHIIDLITENGRKSAYEEGEENNLKKEIRILTIQNQKLVNLVEKMRNKEHRPEETMKVQEHYEKEIGELMETMKVTKEQHEDELRQLRRLYKALNIHCKNVESEKKQLELENSKLLKILKDKNETEKKINDKSRVSEGSEADSEKSQKSQKITLLKIKEQYGQNMKMLRDGLVKQIEETFDTMRIALEGLGSKVTHLTMRLQSIEKFTWQRARKSEKQEKADVYEEVESPLAKNKKSEIYIEEGPDSSHPSHQTSKDEAIDGSRSSSNELREQLAKAKAELEELRFKYDKICLDTSSVSYSKRIPIQNNQLTAQYERVLLQVSKRDKQIQILYGQIRNIEQQNLETSRQRYQEWEEMMENKQNAIAELKEKHYVEIQQIKGETELKVRLLVENYEKQIELLKKQIILKNADLQQATQVSHMHRSDSQNKVEDFYKTIEDLKGKLEQLRRKLEISEGKLRQQEIEGEMDQQGWKKEKEVWQSKYQDLEHACKTDRAKREEIQQQVILQMVELSQYKRETEQAGKRCAELQQKFKDQIEELQTLLQAEKKEKQNLKDQNEYQQAKIAEMKSLLQQSKRDSILGQINELQKMAEAQLEKSKILEKEYAPYFVSENEKIDKLSVEIKDLRETLTEKQEKCIQQQAKIIELQGLCELNRTKFEEQQALHLELLSKHKQLQASNISFQKSLKESVQQGILDKISELRQLEQERIRHIDNALEK